jgi:hypothetical protein
MAKPGGLTWAGRQVFRAKRVPAQARHRRCVNEFGKHDWDVTAAAGLDQAHHVRQYLPSFGNFERGTLVQAKACYCHFYGAGLVDYFLLTGEHDTLKAALDLAEQKIQSSASTANSDPARLPSATRAGSAAAFTSSPTCSKPSRKTTGSPI